MINRGTDWLVMMAADHVEQHFYQQLSVDSWQVQE
jgi:hypothetical protein